MNDYDAQEQVLQEKRKRYSQQLQDGQAPQGRMVGKTFVAPHALEYLAQGLRGFGAMRGEELAGQELQALKSERTGANQSAMANALRMMGGAPADEPLAEGQQGPVRPAQAPDMRGAYAELMKSPDYAQMGQQGMMQLPAMEAQAQARTDDRAFRAQESEMNRAANVERLKQDHLYRMERMDADKASDAQKQKAQQDFQREMLRMTAANRPERQAQIIQTEQGPMQLVGGRAVPIVGPDGKPVMGKVAAGGAATEGERKAATLLQRMQGSEAQLEAALVNDKGAAKPGLISSGLSAIGMGTLANTATPENRQKVEAAQLDILDAALTLGTGAAYTKEQLEGYRKSYFPQLGDKPETIKDKQDRLNNVLSAARIAAGRAGSQVPTPVAPGAPAAPKARMKFDAQGNPIQ